MSCLNGDPKRYNPAVEMRIESLRDREGRAKVTKRVGRWNAAQESGVREGGRKRFSTNRWSALRDLLVH